MLVNIYGAKCSGIEALIITVEVEVSNGIGIHLVGMADTAVKESLLRTTTALLAAGYHIPGKKIVINLAPADLRKVGSGYDLPIALGIIAASGQKTLPELGNYIIMGELGLDGSVRDVQGVLPVAEMAVREGFKGVIVPEASALEAVEFRDSSVFAVKTFDDVVRILEGKEDSSDLLVWNTTVYHMVRRGLHHMGKVESGVDFSEIIGQEGAKRGLEIAAAGGHNVAMVGAPGSGKSSLAKALAGILPKMTVQESIMTSKVYSIAGRGNLRCGLIRTRPFRSPHSGSSLAAMFGGGGGDNVLPGEVSLAHNGVLFLDEVNQLPRCVVEAMRAPLEDRYVTVSRLRTKVTYPASFMLVTAANPCPCGWWGEGERCVCTPSQRQSYISRLSGPVMDRVDIQLWMHSVPLNSLNSSVKPESSATVAERVLKARLIQKQRFAGQGISVNAEMNNRMIEKFCHLTPSCAETMKRIMERYGLSMRAYFRILKVARTIADLEGLETIEEKHLHEAAGFRFLDRSVL